MGRVIKQLVKKIYKDTGIKCDPATFRRTYAGMNQRCAGAFSWLMGIDGREKVTYEKNRAGKIVRLIQPAVCGVATCVGSCDPASDCIRSDREITCGDTQMGVIELFADDRR